MDVGPPVGLALRATTSEKVGETETETVEALKTGAALLRIFTNAPLLTEAVRRFVNDCNTAVAFAFAVGELAWRFT